MSSSTIARWAGGINHTVCEVELRRGNVAIAHGAIAELRVFAKAHIEPRGTRKLLRLIWQASTVDWIAIGVLLISAPWLGSQVARQSVIAVAVVVYGYAAVGNANCHATAASWMDRHELCRCAGAGGPLMAKSTTALRWLFRSIPTSELH